MAERLPAHDIKLFTEIPQLLKKHHLVSENTTVLLDVDGTIRPRSHTWHLARIPQTSYDTLQELIGQGLRLVAVTDNLDPIAGYRGGYQVSRFLAKTHPDCHFFPSSLENLKIPIIGAGLDFPLTIFFPNCSIKTKPKIFDRLGQHLDRSSHVVVVGDHSLDQKFADLISKRYQNKSVYFLKLPFFARRSSS